MLKHMRMLSLLLVVLFVVLATGTAFAAEPRYAVNFSKLKDNGSTPSLTKTVAGASASIYMTSSSGGWSARTRQTSGTVQWVSNEKNCTLSTWNSISYLSGKGLTGYTYKAVVYNQNSTSVTVSGQWDPA